MPDAPNCKRSDEVVTIFPVKQVYVGQQVQVAKRPSETYHASIIHVGDTLGLNLLLAVF